MSGDEAALACLDQHWNGIALVKVPEGQDNVMRSGIMATNGMARRALMGGNGLTARKELTVCYRAMRAQCQSKEPHKNGCDATSWMVYHIALQTNACAAVRLSARIRVPDM